MTNPVLEAIRSRRSVRQFLPEKLPDDAVAAVLEAARRAPSGLNNQPWRFFLAESPEVRERLAACTKYGRLLRGAPLAIAVFLDTESSYHREKDLQAIGAAIENLLLAAGSLGLGACWIGEILNRRAEVEAVLGTPGHLELAAVVVLGYPEPELREGRSGRRELAELVVGRA